MRRNFSFLFFPQLLNIYLFCPPTSNLGEFVLNNKTREKGVKEDEREIGETVIHSPKKYIHN